MITIEARQCIVNGKVVLMFELEDIVRVLVNPQDAVITDATVHVKIDTGEYERANAAK